MSERTFLMDAGWPWWSYRDEQLVGTLLRDARDGAAWEVVGVDREARAIQVVSWAPDRVFGPSVGAVVESEA